MTVSSRLSALLIDNYLIAIFEVTRNHFCARTVSKTGLDADRNSISISQDVHRSFTDTL
jgi:hypothetical protein